MLDQAGKLSTDDSGTRGNLGATRTLQRQVGGLIYRPSIAAVTIVVVFAGIVIGWAGWKRGMKSGVRFAIHGPSMAPTLLGEHQIAKCVACGLDWPIEIPEEGKRVICFHCGALAKVANGAHAASVVVVHPYEHADAAGAISASLDIGDVVAISGEDMMRIKRIIALPGDLVELNAASLLVNGKTIQKTMRANDDLKIPVPPLLFEMDNRRELSRWRGKGWQRNEQRIWTPEAQGWLIYHHRSIHQRNQPSSIWDDYPYNAGLSRKLQPATRLALKAKVACKGQAQLEVVFWIDEQMLGVTCEVNGSCDLSISSDDAVAVEVPPLSAKTPVAIRVLEGSVKLSCLQLARQIEYRLRPYDDRSRYPIRLGSREYFVVGDNVPVSVDSRDFGVINERAIKGRVEFIQTQ